MPSSPEADAESAEQTQGRAVMLEGEPPEHLKRTRSFGDEASAVASSHRVGHPTEIENQEVRLVHRGVLARECETRNGEKNADESQKNDTKVLSHTVGPPLVPVMLLSRCRVALIKIEVKE